VSRLADMIDNPAKCYLAVVKFELPEQS